MLFLEEFWNGNIAPGEGRYHSQKEYREAWGLVESMEDQLKEQLAPRALGTVYQVPGCRTRGGLHLQR